MSPTLGHARVTESRGADTRELALLSPSAVPSRRADFVAGRLAAKRAIAAHLARSESSIVVLRDEGEHAGRPRALDAERLTPLPVEVSITHTRGCAVAAVADRPVGIDLVDAADLSAALREEVFAAGELEEWTRAAGDEAGAALAFAAKEAALKWIGCGLRVPARSVTVRPLTRPDTRAPFAVELRHAGATHLCEASFGRVDDLYWLAIV